MPAMSASASSGTNICEAYEEMIRGTATDEAPWYVVPADHKWFTRLVVAAAIVERLEAIDPQFPKLTTRRKALEAARAALRGGRKG